jgi:hypothetical protein
VGGNQLMNKGNMHRPDAACKSRMLPLCTWLRLSAVCSIEQSNWTSWGRHPPPPHPKTRACDAAAPTHLGPSQAQQLLQVREGVACPAGLGGGHLRACAGTQGSHKQQQANSKPLGAS